MNSFWRKLHRGRVTAPQTSLQVVIPSAFFSASVRKLSRRFPDFAMARVVADFAFRSFI